VKKGVNIHLENSLPLYKAMLGKKVKTVDYLLKKGLSPKKFTDKMKIEIAQTQDYDIVK
jgi:hypothetical protein